MKNNSPPTPKKSSYRTLKSESSSNWSEGVSEDLLGDSKDIKNCSDFVGLFLKRSQTSTFESNWKHYCNGKFESSSNFAFDLPNKSSNSKSKKLFSHSINKITCLQTSDIKFNEKH